MYYVISYHIISYYIILLFAFIVDTSIKNILDYSRICFGEGSWRAILPQIPSRFPGHDGSIEVIAIRKNMSHSGEMNPKNVSNRHDLCNWNFQNQILPRWIPTLEDHRLANPDPFPGRRTWHPVEIGVAIAGPRVHTTKMLDFDEMIHTPRSYHLVMTNSSPWNITMLLIGKPSISMGQKKPWHTMANC